MLSLFLFLVIWLFSFTPAYSQNCDIGPIEGVAKAASTTTFDEISRDLISRLEAYFTVNGRYASQQKSANFQDIGLNSGEWEGKNYDGIVYTPRGNTLEVYPAQGYTFFIDEPNGNTQILSWDIHWPLIYNLADKEWYFHEIASDAVVNIDTLQVKKDTPYNPQEYTN